MKIKIFFIVIVILSSIFSGCTASKSSISSESPISGVSMAYYDEGIKLVNQYCSEEVIKKFYLDAKSKSADTFAKEQQARIKKYEIWQTSTNKSITTKMKPYLQKRFPWY